MGLDIYAGTLTRYYCGNWKSVVQQFAEANGMTFSRITPDGEEVDDEKPNPEEVQADVEDWRDAVLDAVSPEGQRFPSWVENNEDEYFTDKPDWDAYGAMLLYAAAKTYEEPLPKTVNKDWDFSNHPLISRMLNDKNRKWSLFDGATMWIPIKDSFMFKASDPCGNDGIIGTIGGLNKELEKINKIGWQADEKTIISWSDTEGYPVDSELQKDGTVKNLGEHNEYDTESLAKFAYSIFYQALKFAEKNGVSVLLDS